MRWPTLVRLSTSRPGAPAGEPVVLAAEVTVLGATQSAPTGRVSFHTGVRLLGTAPLDPAGRAVLADVRLPVGFHGLVASYDGDDQHAGGSSPPTPQAVLAPGIPVVVAVAAPRVSPEGVRLEVELLDAESGRLASDAEGEVVFVADDGEVGRARVRGGQASLLVDTPPAGVLEAHFGGGPDHAPGHGSRAAGP